MDYRRLRNPGSVAGMGVASGSGMQLVQAPTEITGVLGASGAQNNDIAIGHTVDVDRSLFVLDSEWVSASTVESWHFVSGYIINSTTVRGESQTDSVQHGFHGWVVELTEDSVNHVEVLAPTPNFNVGAGSTAYTASITGASGTGVDPDKSFVIPTWQYTNTSNSAFEYFEVIDTEITNATTFTINVQGLANPFTTQSIHYVLIEGK